MLVMRLLQLSQRSLHVPVSAHGFCDSIPVKNAGNQNKLPPFPARLLTGALALSVLLMAGLAWSAWQYYRKVGADQQQSLRIKELQGIIIHLDEVLTMSARMAALTGDPTWERRYRQFEPQLDAAVKEALVLASQMGNVSGAAQTDAANLKLVEMENQSFALVHEGWTDAARALLFGPEYETQKKIYAEGTAQLDRQLGEHLKSHEKAQRREAGFCILASAVVVGLLLVTWVTVLSRLRHWRTVQLRSFDPLAHAEEELPSAHSLLEMRVQERTAELRKASLELQASEARVRAITDSAQDAILMMDPEGRISHWNPAAERILGYTSAEAIGQSLHEFIAPERFHPAHHAAFPAFRQTGQGAAVGKTLDLEARRKDGQEISVQVSLSAIQINGGWHAVGILRDITERKQAEAVLRRQAAIIDLSPDAVIVRSQDGTILSWSLGAENLYGWTKEEALGRVTHALFQTRFPEPLEEIVEQFGKTGRWSGELVHRTKDGREVIVQSRWLAEFSVLGERTGMLESNIDITERKQAEVKLQKTLDSLRKAHGATIQVMVSAWPAPSMTSENYRSLRRYCPNLPS